MMIYLVLYKDFKGYSVNVQKNRKKITHTGL